MASTDAQNGLIPQVGSRVDFALYSDASGVGAQQVRSAAGGEGGLAQQLHQPSQVKGVMKTIQKAKFLPAAKALPGRVVAQPQTHPKFRPAPAQKWAVKTGQANVVGTQLAAPMQPKAKVAPGKAKIWSGAARANAAKAGTSDNAAASSKAGTKASKVSAERTPVQGSRWFTGAVTQFFGRFGWIKPDTKIHHPMADAHKGLIYCHVDNAAPSCTEIVKGMAVKFKVYADETGLGAQEIQDKFAHVAPAAKVAAAPILSPGGKSGQAFAKGAGAAKGGGKGAAAPKAAPNVLAVQKTIQKHGKGGKAAGGAAESKFSPPGVAVSGAHSKGKGKGGASATSANVKGASKGAAAKGATVKGSAAKGSATKGGAAKGAGSKGAGKAAGKGSGSAVQQPSMPPNWEEHWSDEHAVPYFWNRVSKESRWVKPSK